MLDFYFIITYNLLHSFSTVMSFFFRFRSSTPTNFYFTDENLENDVEVSHKFIIGNTGPSPIKLDVFLVLPIIKTDEIDIFDVDAKV